LTFAKKKDTSRVSIHTTKILGRTVHLLDTPGFNDSHRSDEETLQELAYWLAAAYERDVKLSGIVYLHCITNTRLQGSAARALDAFKKMCGDDAFGGVVVATTFWDTIPTDELTKAQNRHEELHGKIRDDILRHGGRIVSLSAVEIDAMNILRHIVSKARSLTLTLQRQLVDENRLLHQTDAGKALFGHLTQRYQSLESTTNEAQKRMTGATKTGRMDQLDEIGDAVTEMAENMRTADANIERARVNLSDIRETWEHNINQDDERLAATTRLIEQQLEAERNRQGKSGSASFANSSSAEITSVPSDTASHIAAFSRDVHQPSEAYMTLRLEELERERQALTVQMGQRLNRRRGRGATTFGVLGTSLAVGQLIAALACVVM
jgi:hypothetical protein